MGDDARASGTGLFSTTGALAGNVLKLFGVRVSYAILELADARDALLRVLLLGAAALGAAALAAVCVSALVVALFWDTLGWRILLILFVLYAALSVWLLMRAMRIVNEGQLGLPVTLAELQKDRAALFGDTPIDGDSP